MTVNATTLHYIYDPLCGWCYAAAPLIKAAREVVRIAPHGGGMMIGMRRQAVTPQLRAYVAPHDERIAQMSGQPFGADYRDGLLRDPAAVFDSEPPTAAMLAAEELGGRGLDMLAKLQTAHYVDGRRIAERSVLIAVATNLGLDESDFASALDRQSGSAVQAHIRDTRALMARVGAQGFPTFVLEREGFLQTIDVAGFLGRPHDFQAWLRHHAQATTPPSAPGAWVCDAGGCAR